MREGDVDHAVLQFQEALRLHPDFPEAEENLRIAKQSETTQWTRMRREFFVLSVRVHSFIVVRFFGRRAAGLGSFSGCTCFLRVRPSFPCWIYLDDESHLTQNPCIVGPLGPQDIWTPRSVYYPLVPNDLLGAATNSSVYFHFPYHILNVLMHAGATVCFGACFEQLGVSGAWLGAALWALHPVMVQSVAWVTELKNTQSCLFYLLSISLFLDWQEQTRSQGSSVDRGGLFLSIAGLLRNGNAKQAFGGHVTGGARSLCLVRRGRIGWKDAIPLAPFLLISALASTWTIWEQKFHASAVGPEWAQTCRSV